MQTDSIKKERKNFQQQAHKLLFNEFHFVNLLEKKCKGEKFPAFYICKESS